MSARTLKIIAAAIAVSAGLAAATVSTGALADAALAMKADAARALPPGNERTAVAEASDPLTSNPMIVAKNGKARTKAGVSTTGVDRASKRKRSRRYARRQR